MKTVQLKEIASIERTAVSPEKVKSGTNYVGLEHIDEDGNFIEVAPVDNGDLRSTKFCFKPSHVLYGKLRPYLRKIARPVFEGICSTDILPILPGSEIDKDYLFHFLRTKEMVSLATRRCSGANLPRLSPKTLEQFEIPLPPLPEQKRIAAILDKADAIRRKRQEAIKLSEQFLRSVFLEMFGDLVTNPKGWKETTLCQVSEIVSGVTKGRRLEGKETVLAPYLRVANVQDGFLDLAEMKDIEVLRSDVEKYRLMEGDVVLTEGGDYDKLGRGAIWKGEIDDCIHQNHIFRVRIEINELLPEYLSALIGSPRGKRYFLRQAKQTTGIATINSRQLKAFPVLLPPKELQVRYHNLVTERGALGDKMFNSDSGINTLFDSLSQRAFRGEL